MFVACYGQLDYGLEALELCAGAGVRYLRTAVVARGGIWEIFN